MITLFRRFSTAPLTRLRLILWRVRHHLAPRTKSPERDGHRSARASGRGGPAYTPAPAQLQRRDPGLKPSVKSVSGIDAGSPATDLTQPLNTQQQHAIGLAEKPAGSQDDRQAIAEAWRMVSEAKTDDDLVRAYSALKPRQIKLGATESRWIREANQRIQLLKQFDEALKSGQDETIYRLARETAAIQSSVGGNTAVGQILSDPVRQAIARHEGCIVFREACEGDDEQRIVDTYTDSLRSSPTLPEELHRRAEVAHRRMAAARTIEERIGSPDEEILRIYDAELLDVAQTGGKDLLSFWARSRVTQSAAAVQAHLALREAIKHGDGDIVSIWERHKSVLSAYSGLTSQERDLVETAAHRHRAWSLLKIAFEQNDYAAAFEVFDPALNQSPELTREQRNFYEAAYKSVLDARLRSYVLTQRDSEEIAAQLIGESN